MGDPQKGCIVAQGVESFFVDDTIQLADIMGPNLYELRELTGKQLRRFDEVVEAAKQLVARGVKKVLVKLSAPDTKSRHITRNLFNIMQICRLLALVTECSGGGRPDPPEKQAFEILLVTPEQTYTHSPATVYFRPNASRGWGSELQLNASLIAQRLCG
ncbi:PfkB family carbohydrate kinase [Escherichia coli O156:H5]